MCIRGSFGALTLAVSTTITSCKDYDDDVKNLQEQIDKINTSNPVSYTHLQIAGIIQQLR